MRRRSLAAAAIAAAAAAAFAGWIYFRSTSPPGPEIETAPSQPVEKPERQIPEATPAKPPAPDEKTLRREAAALLKAGRLADAANQVENLANQAFVLAKPAAALDYYSQAIVLRSRLGMYDLLSKDFAWRAYILRNEGNIEAAQADFLAALDAGKLAGDRYLQATAINGLASLLGDQGDRQKAHEAYERAFVLAEDVPKAAYLRIQILRSQAGLYLVEGNRPEAVRLLASGLREAERRNDLKAKAELLMDHGWIRHLTQEPHAALGYYLEAADFVQLLTPFDQAVFFDRLGTTLIDLNRPEEAWQAYRNALEVTRAARLSNIDAGIWINLCMTTVKFPQLELEDESRRATCGQAQIAAAKARDPNMLSSFYYWQAQHLLHCGLLKEAIASAEAGMGLTDTVRLTIAGRNSRSRFLEKRARVFRYLADVLMLAHQADPGGGYDRTALRVSERLRARSALELWSEAGVDLLATADPKLRQAVDRKMDELQDLVASRSRPVQDELISKTLDDLDRLNQQWRQSSVKTRGLTPPAAIPIDEIQERLGRDTAIVVLLFGEKRSHLFIIDGQRVRTFELAAPAVLEEAANRFIRLLADPDAATSPAGPLAAGRRLAELLWGAREERLEGLPDRLVFLGDGALQLLPLGALPRLAKDFEDPRYLIESFEVVHLPALTLLSREFDEIRSRDPPTRSAILLGDPFYQLASESNIRMRKLSDNELQRVFGTNAGNLMLGRLPYADVEAQRIQAAFGKREIEVATGTQASKDRALRPDIGTYSIVHLASHGRQDSSHPELSALLLSEVDAQGRRVDGSLRLQDLYGLPTLRAELVVASACQTGVGGNLRLEGIGGIAQGFFQAGARRTLVSLWQVESESTAILMDHFYQHLLSGEAPGLALRNASLDLMRIAREQQKPWSAPFYWSPFILIGDWLPFDLPVISAKP